MGSRRDRLILALVAALTLVLALVTTPEREPQVFDFRPSSFHSTSHGTRALYLLLDELGVPVERRLKPLMAPPPGGALALLAPTSPLTPGELAVLLDWVEAGGVLLYAARPGDPTLEALGLGELVSLGGREGRDSVGAQWGGVATGESADTGSARALAGSGSGEVVAKAGAGFSWAFADTAPALRGPTAVPLRRTAAGEVVAVTWREGAGRVVAWSDVAPLRNGSLRRNGDAAVEFARAAVAASGGEGGGGEGVSGVGSGGGGDGSGASSRGSGAPRGGGVGRIGRTVVFDEYHHGYRGDGSAAAATLGYLTGAGPGRMALQLAVAAAGLLLLSGWRFGTPLPMTPAARRSPLEYLEALAGVYRQAGARSTARRLLLAQLARRLGHVPPRTAEEESGLLDELAVAYDAGRGAGEGGGDVVDRIEGLRAVWRRGERVDLVRLAREVDELVAEVKDR